MAGRFFNDLKEIGIKNILFNFFEQSDAPSSKITTSDNSVTLDVLFFTEGTYPFVRGGVSTVIHQIIQENPQLTFGVIYIGWDRDNNLISKYPTLDNLKSIDTLFLNEYSVEKPLSLLQKLYAKPFDAKSTHELFQAFVQMRDENSYEALEKIYFDYFNPNTRKSDLIQILNSTMFLEILLNKYTDTNMTLNDLFWLQKDLIHLLDNLVGRCYPKAKVYHSHTQGYAGFAASLAALQNDGEFFLTEHSLYLRDVKGYIDNNFVAVSGDPKVSIFYKMCSIQKKNAWNTWFDMLGKWTYHHASAISYLYQKIACDAQALGAASERCHIIPNGINPDDFSPVRIAQSDRSLHREKNDHVWIISLVGRVVPVKGILDMIQTAFEMLQLTHKPFVIELVGPVDEDPAYYSQCITLVKSLQLETVVKFLGPQKVTEYLRQSDMVVLSSHSEALPMALLEAMACSLPVVSTNVGSVEDIVMNPIHDQKLPACGLVVEKQNPQRLAMAVCELMNNSNLYQEMAQAGLKRVESGYSLNKVMQKYNTLYKFLGSKRAESALLN
jgi:polysaccharide biosynthesis protein PelF